MGNPALIMPAAVLAFWTMAVIVYGAFRRVGAVQAGKVKARRFVAGQGEQPEDLAAIERNIANLCETPLLFYVVTLWGYNLGTGHVFVGICWLYVGLRIVHSLIHLGPNIVIPR